MNLFGNRFFAAPDVAGSGGYVWPGTGGGGYLNTSSGIPFYEGATVISDIPEFQRDYNLNNELVTRIEEGRFNMMRILFDYAQQGGTYITDDVQARWYLDYKASPRFYLKIRANQGGAVNTAVKTGQFVLNSTADAKRLQAGDLIVLMFASLVATRDANSAAVTYVASPAAGAIYVKKVDATKPSFEICRVDEVNYTTGALEVTRNIGGDGQTASRSGMGVTVEANGTGAAGGASFIRAEDAFFIKVTRPMAEGRDDATVWSSSNTWDYNYCQYVLRKWGVTDIQNNVRRRGQPEQQYAKNRREAIEQYLEETEYYSIFGFRKEDYNAEGEWIGHAGGFLEAVPSGHYDTLEEPEYGSTTKAGDFTIKKFNKFLANKFYYGSQNKVLLCGEQFHTAFSWMINNMTQNIPVITDRWAVRGRLFECSNGGSVFVVPSDTLSLNGMGHMALLMDPSTFQFGNLQNMGTTIVDPLPSTNIHRKSGEIFSVFTFKRTNFDANWVFVMQPNVET